MSVPRYWREIPQRYTLQASRCSICKATYFPPREVCPVCRRTSIGKMTPVKLAGTGTVLEWTRVHKAAPGYEMQVPYVLAMVQTPEGPRIIGQIVDSESSTITEGAEVNAVFRRIGEDGLSGVIYYGTKWKVARQAPVAEATAEPDKKKRKLGRNK